MGHPHPTTGAQPHWDTATGVGANLTPEDDPDDDDWDTTSNNGADNIPSTSDDEWDAVSVTSDTSDWAVTVSAQESKQSTARIAALEYQVACLQDQCNELTDDLNCIEMENKLYITKYDQQTEEFRNLQAKMDNFEDKVKESEAEHLSKAQNLLAANEQLEATLLHVNNAFQAENQELKK